MIPWFLQEAEAFHVIPIDNILKQEREFDHQNILYWPFKKFNLITTGCDRSNFSLHNKITHDQTY